MPLPTIPDHYYVAANFQRSDGDAVVNTFCFRNMSTEQSPAEFAATLRDLLDTFYGTGSTLLNTVGQYLAPTLFGLSYVIYDLGSPDAGGFELPSLTFRDSADSAASMLPPDCAVTISWSTALRGRSFRGRTYLGPLKSTTNSADGTVNAQSRDQIAAAAQLLIGDLLTRSAVICVLSRTRGVATEVTGGYIDNEFDTQRRRGFRSTVRTPIPT